MKKNNIFTILFPSIFIILLMLIFPFTNQFNGIDFKGIFIISLIFILPLLFLLQGIKSAINNVNLILSAGLSLLTFILFIIICLNSSAIIYIFTGLILEIIGYIVTKYTIKNKYKNN